MHTNSTQYLLLWHYEFKNLYHNYNCCQSYFKQYTATKLKHQFSKSILFHAYFLLQLPVLFKKNLKN